MASGQHRAGRRTRASARLRAGGCRRAGPALLVLAIALCAPAPAPADETGKAPAIPPAAPVAAPAAMMAPTGSASPKSGAAPEPAPGASGEAERAPESAAPSTPSVPGVPGGVPFPGDEAIHPVQRPPGFWGAAAVAGDLLVMRPLGFASLVPGAAAFVITSPVSAALGTLGEGLQALEHRAKDVFERPLGAI
jgi:hypothetical protein